MQGLPLQAAELALYLGAMGSHASVSNGKDVIRFIFYVLFIYGCCAGMDEACFLGMCVYPQLGGHFYLGWGM